MSLIDKSNKKNRVFLQSKKKELKRFCTKCGTQLIKKYVDSWDYRTGLRYWFLTCPKEGIFISHTSTELTIDEKQV